MGWWERAFCLWLSDHRVSHLWACPSVMLMESHTLGKGCKIHGVESLTPRPLLNKASMTGYHVCVASKRGWCLPAAGRQSQAVKNGSTLFTWFLSRCQGGPPKSSEVTSLCFSLAFLTRKHMVQTLWFSGGSSLGLLCVNLSACQGLPETLEPFVIPFPSELIQSGALEACISISNCNLCHTNCHQLLLPFSLKLF